MQNNTILLNAKNYKKNISHRTDLCVTYHFQKIVLTDRPLCNGRPIRMIILICKCSILLDWPCFSFRRPIEMICKQIRPDYHLYNSRPIWMIWRTGWHKVRELTNRVHRQRRFSSIAKTPNIRCFVAKMHLSRFTRFFRGNIPIL